MPPTQDEVSSRWQWLGWWFVPRWRALVTWIALAALTRWATYYHWKQVNALYHWPIDLMNSFSPTPLPGFVDTIALSVNMGVLSAWFEPLALRLNLWRAAAWVGVGIALNLIANFVTSNISGSWPDVGLSLLSAAATAFVLRRWRSRPWMVFVAGAVAFAVVSMLQANGMMIVIYRSPVWTAGAAAFIHAAILLYGTRLLTPEERAQRQGSQTRPLPNVAAP